MFNLFKSKAKNITKSEIDGMFNGVWTHMKAVEQQLEEVKDEVNAVKTAVNKLTYISWINENSNNHRYSLWCEK